MTSPLDDIKKIEIRQGYDFHLHLRDGDVMRSILPHSAKEFLGGIIMPNLKPPVTTTQQALDYFMRITDACAYHEIQFLPLMTLYLTDNTTIEEIEAAHSSSFIYGFKLYPAGATTNSDEGVTDILGLYPLFEKMQDLDMPLLIHGEVTEYDVDIFDREKKFIDTILTQIVSDFTELRIVLEHVTTTAGVEFVEASSDKVAATITAHHLTANRNHMLVGGIRPDMYCLPILKRESDRQSLRWAVTSPSKKFFLGTDSAPHSTKTKHSSCGCAGCFTAPLAMPLYTEIFESIGRERGDASWPQLLENFASINGSRFYRLPISEETIVLKKNEWIVPEFYKFGERPIYTLERTTESHGYTDENYQVKPFLANKVMQWEVVQQKV